MPTALDPVSHSSPITILAVDDNPEVLTFLETVLQEAGYRVLRAEGKYEEAASHLETVLAQYPRDRVALNQIARLSFLKREYAKAIEALRAVNAVDPEDVQMHYTWMLAARGLGDTAGAEREEKLFRRFKAEEASQALTARLRASSPEDNNERQSIHDHESAVK